MAALLPPLRPIPIKERLSILYIEHGKLDVLDGAFVVVDKNGVRTHVPVGGVACLMLEPGTRVSHAACALAARVGTLLVWIGEAGVRLVCRRPARRGAFDRLLYQAQARAGRRPAPESGAQDVRPALWRGAATASAPWISCAASKAHGCVRCTSGLAAKYGVEWRARNYDP
jgi:CRISPR-associated protein Cas1